MKNTRQQACVRWEKEKGLNEARSSGNPDDFRLHSLIDAVDIARPDVMPALRRVLEQLRQAMRADFASLFVTGLYEEEIMIASGSPGGLPEWEKSLDRVLSADRPFFGGEFLTSLEASPGEEEGKTASLIVIPFPGKDGHKVAVLAARSVRGEGFTSGEYRRLLKTSGHVYVLVERIKLFMKQENSLSSLRTISHVPEILESMEKMDCSGERAIQAIANFIKTGHRSLDDAAATLAEAIEERDPYTGGHIKRVLKYSLDIAGCLQISPSMKETLRLSAILHDMGKIAIDERLLQKKKPLNEREQAVIRNHPVYGTEILLRIKELQNVIPGMLHHHERVDGSGYPLGLKGRQIPWVARIIAVADSYDAMTTSRSYKDGCSPEEAMEELRHCAGTQFDSEVVDAFLEAGRKGNLTGEH